MNKAIDTRGLPDNLRVKDGLLTTATGASVQDYLNERWADKVGKAAQPVVLLTRDAFLELVKDHEELQRRRRAEMSEDERFCLAA